jgi:DNA-binding SARP family transcriptional activator
MIAAAHSRNRLPTLARAFASAAILATLWLFRPRPPALPSSLSAPLTIETIEAVTLWLLWLAATLLALALLIAPRRLKHPLPIAAFRRALTTSTLPRPHIARPHSQPPSLVLVPREHASVALKNGGPAPLELAPSADHLAAAQEAAPERPRVSVLGPLTITGAKRSRRGLRARALELIAYLALHPRPVPRDGLLEAFWPSEDPRRTRPRLRQAVRDARRLLGDAIVGEHGSYWLDRAAVDVDLDELERLFAAKKAAEPEHAQALTESTLGLFRGEPLAGADYTWSETKLASLRATFVSLLEQVARHRLEDGEPGAALDAAERGLQVDTLNESLWRLAMEAENALGLRDAIAERYERLRTLLGERLGLEPAQETRHLYRRLLAQN